jgi:hypothetical protein
MSVEAFACVVKQAFEAGESINLVFHEIAGEVAELIKKGREENALKEALLEIMELYNEYYDECGEMKLLSCFDDEPRERFHVVNEKKRRRIKNKDRFLRWFVMTARNNAR